MTVFYQYIQLIHNGFFYKIEIHVFFKKIQPDNDKMFHEDWKTSRYPLNIRALMLFTQSFLVFKPTSFFLRFYVDRFNI